MISNAVLNKSNFGTRLQNFAKTNEQNTAFKNKKCVCGSMLASRVAIIALVDRRLDRQLLL